MADLTARPEDYGAFLDALKPRVRSARLNAAGAVNQELIGLYGSIGHDIAERERRAGWGAKIISQLASDLQAAFPEMTGLSPRATCAISRAPIPIPNLCSRLLPTCWARGR